MTGENPLAEATVERVAPPAILVVFGASGDLTSRKLMPAVENLALRRLLPAGFSVVGVARTEMGDDEFRERMREAVAESGGGGEEAKHVWESFTGGFRYVAGDYTNADTFKRLKDVLDELDEARGTAQNRLYYLATPPDTFPIVVQGLAACGLTRPAHDEAFVRIVIEKPFGRDTRSAEKLDEVVHEAFEERQVYRIDHYLGKETVQNVLALRFANAIFEPIWNRRYVDHVQITVAEQLGVGHRGGFYESAGALRDIVQNHVMQVLALTLMEPPATFDAGGIRDEKVKALRAVDIMSADEVSQNVVRAQYRAGWVQGSEAQGYRDEEGVDPHSQTETYLAMRLHVDNWRWAGVPIYIRTGKYLPKRVTEVAMEFKTVPHLPFATSQAEGLEPDALVLRIQPDEGITLRFGAKVPGQAFRVRSVSMDFFYGAAFLEETPEAYERLLLDALLGDPTLFIRSDEVAQAWRIVEPVIDAFENGDLPLARYEAGTWGPPEADALLDRDGRHWRKP
ncbi:MAG TPA: glucose-6-phosphate dehydrogenase [Acidimicrobiales bacterium]|jgi:glucose-6-phosphate 1-dehydrogenase|nr:glucose-6-phosphate dehydrogenase [Acidimicrobiales bacterium]